MTHESRVETPDYKLYDFNKYLAMQGTDIDTLNNEIIQHTKLIKDLESIVSKKRQLLVEAMEQQRAKSCLWTSPSGKAYTVSYVAPNPRVPKPFNAERLMNVGVTPAQLEMAREYTERKATVMIKQVGKDE
jgi:DNA-binding transcriptional MocR family regulator